MLISGDDDFGLKNVQHRCSKATLASETARLPYLAYIGALCFARRDSLVDTR
jgi:hypothetical protein